MQGANSSPELRRSDAPPGAQLRNHAGGRDLWSAAVGDLEHPGAEALLRPTFRRDAGLQAPPVPDSGAR